MATILVINGPNLNLLGTREPDTYGYDSLDHIMTTLESRADELGHQLQHLQSNAEHEIVESIQNSVRHVDMLIFNPAAFTHTSVACRDALLATKMPFIEVHLSNVDAREQFRQHSYFSDIAIGRIAGFGPFSYQLALQAAHHYLTTT